MLGNQHPLQVSLSGDTKMNKQISSDTMFRIKSNSDLPMSTMIDIMKEIRKDIGRQGKYSKYLKFCRLKNL